MPDTPSTNGRQARGWTVRSRLTIIAAGAVAVALAIAGPVSTWGVEYRMLEDLRERDRMHAATEGLLRGQGAIDRPGPGRRGRPGGRPPVVPFPAASLLILEHGREPEFRGSADQAPEDLLTWLESLRQEPGLSSLADRAGDLFAEAARMRRECRPGRPEGKRDERPQFRPPPPPERGADPEHEACLERARDAHQRAAAQVAQIPWPQVVTTGVDQSRSLRTALVVRLPEEGHPRAIAIESSLVSVDATLRALWRSLAFGGPSIVALVALVAWLLVGRSLRVVGEMSREIEEIAFGALDRRLHMPTTRDEVASLVETLNRMLDRIDEGARRQREFVGDASHELRTPIATIRTRLEVALSRPDSADWTQVAKEANGEAIRMQRLVDDLLRIARLDDSPAEAAKEREEVDLDDVVRHESAVLRDSKVGLSGVSPVRVHGIEQDLRRIVRNLLENAERYGEGRIEVALCRDGDEARLEVDDDGPGIPVDARESVFERFTRLDESRSRSGGGTGLGLALTRGLVEAHGGRIHIETAPLGGARVVVTLPCDRARRLAVRVLRA